MKEASSANADVIFGRLRSVGALDTTDLLRLLDQEIANEQTKTLLYNWDRAKKMRLPGLNY